MPLRHLEL
ncbi:uncharacterized protein FFNC_11493 [Fusarium fujikuroi]|nr:uncharacterized protein FFNC_11493 [Fusarium fujikuroi]